jgi:acyl carrier protein
MNTQATIERFILEELLQGSSRKRIEMDEPLISSGVIDSLAMLRLISFLEEELRVTIGDGEVVPESFETLRRILQFVERKHAEAARSNT